MGFAGFFLGLTLIFLFGKSCKKFLTKVRQRRYNISIIISCGGFMKVKVRVASDYSKSDITFLNAMLLEQNQEIERLRSELRLSLEKDQQTVSLQEELLTTQEDARCWKARAIKAENIVRAMEDKQKFFSVLCKARKEGWLSLFEPNMTAKQRGWYEEWKKELNESLKFFLSVTETDSFPKVPGYYYRIFK